MNDTTRPTTGQSTAPAPARGRARRDHPGFAVYYFIGATFLFVASAFASTQLFTWIGLVFAIPAAVVFLVGFVVLARETARA